MPPAETAVQRGRDGRLQRLIALPWPALALLALAVATFVGFLVYPTYPNYDSYYSLLWGRELLHGQLPSFDEYRSPTEHPLAVAFGAALSLLGRSGDRVMVFFTEASFVVLCAGIYRLTRLAFTPLIGLAAAGILCTRFDFPFLAARAYIDIPYLAFVVWAAAFELVKAPSMAKMPGRRDTASSASRAAAGSSGSCWPAPACCAPRRGSSSASTSCGCAPGRSAPPTPTMLPAAHASSAGPATPPGPPSGPWSG